MYTLHYTEVKKIEMPGRVIYPMVGPDGIKSTQMSFGITLLPPKSRMELCISCASFKLKL